MSDYSHIVGINDGAEYEAEFWAEVEAREAEEAAERAEAEAWEAKELANMEDAFRYIEWSKHHPVLAWISNYWWAFYHWVRKGLIG